MKKLFLFFLLSLVLISSSFALEASDKSLSFFEKIFTQTEQSILTTSAKVGEKVDVTLTFVPFCENNEQLGDLFARMTIWLGNEKQGEMLFASKVECNKLSEAHTDFVPAKAGEYEIHYAVYSYKLGGQNIYVKTNTGEKALYEKKIISVQSNFQDCKEYCGNFNEGDDILGEDILVIGKLKSKTCYTCTGSGSSDSYTLSEANCNKCYTPSGKTCNKINNCILDEEVSKNPVITYTFFIENNECVMKQEEGGFANKLSCINQKNKLQAEAKAETKSATEQTTVTSWLSIKDKCTKVQSTSGFTTEKLCKEELSKPKLPEEENGDSKTTNKGLYIIGGFLALAIIIVVMRRK